MIDFLVAHPSVDLSLGNLLSSEGKGKVSLLRFENSSFLQLAHNSLHFFHLGILAKLPGLDL